MLSTFRPFVFLATLLTLLSLVFYVLSVASSEWLIRYDIGIREDVGPFKTCLRSVDSRIDECRRVDDTCTAEFSSPLDILTVFTSCHQLRTIRAFLIISIVLTTFQFLSMYTQSFFPLYMPLRYPSTLLSLSAFSCGLIAWAIFVHQARTLDVTYGYGPAFGLLTTAWILNLVSWFFQLCPWPYTKADRYAFQEMQQPNAPTIGLWPKLISSWGMHRPHKPSVFARYPGMDRYYAEKQAKQRLYSGGGGSNIIGGTSSTATPHYTEKQLQSPRGQLVTGRRDEERERGEIYQSQQLSSQQQQKLYISTVEPRTSEQIPTIRPSQ